MPPKFEVLPTSMPLWIKQQLKGFTLLLVLSEYFGMESYLEETSLLKMMVCKYNVHENKWLLEWTPPVATLIFTMYGRVRTLVNE